MKNFFSKIGWWILALVCVTLIIVAVIFGFSKFFVGLWNIAEDIGGGSGVVGLLILPFAIIGVINMFRGFLLLLEKDSDRFDFNQHTWKACVYVLINMIGYIVVSLAIKNL